MGQHRWDGSLKKDGFNETTYYMLFRDFYNLGKDEQSSEEKYRIYRNICNFTILPLKNVINIILNFKNKEQNKIKKNKKNEYVYLDKDYKIIFSMLSKEVENIQDKKELESYKRLGKCHLRSLYLASIIPNSWVLTGYITLKQAKFLHSVVEIEKDGKLYILDWTKNLIISKEDYFTLTRFHEISRINNEDVSNELAFLKESLFSLKAYTLFRDEIVLALKKNNQLIKKKVY